MHNFQCPQIFDISTISGYYSQTAGVLAGFALAALVVLMTPTQVEERASQPRGRENGVLLTLFVAFISLILATISYSVLAGINSNLARGATASSELIDGVPFALAVIMLFHGLTLLLDDAGADRAAVWSARAITIVGGPFIAFAFLSNGTLDTELARPGNTAESCAKLGLPGYISALTVILPILLTVVLIPKFQIPALRSRIRKFRSVGPTTVLVASVISMIVGVRVQNSPTFLLSAPELNVLVIGLFVFFILLGVILSYGYPSYRTSGRLLEEKTDPPIEETSARKQDEPSIINGDGYGRRRTTCLWQVIAIMVWLLRRALGPRMGHILRRRTASRRHYQ